MSIRVLIADDHPVVRDGLRFCVERSGSQIEVVGEAADGAEALSFLEAHPVDVVILDITMPRLNGLDVTRELVRRRVRTKILILSIHTSHALVEEALACGAHGYLSKEAASSHVVEAVLQICAGRTYLSPDIAHPAAGMATRASSLRKSAALTTRERKVLQLIAEGRSTKEIAAELGRAIETVRAHRKNLMAKLDIHKQADLVRLAVREGIAKL